MDYVVGFQCVGAQGEGFVQAEEGFPFFVVAEIGFYSVVAHPCEVCSETNLFFRFAHMTWRYDGRCKPGVCKHLIYMGEIILSDTAECGPERTATHCSCREDSFYLSHIVIGWVRASAISRRLPALAGVGFGKATANERLRYLRAKRMVWRLPLFSGH